MCAGSLSLSFSLSLSCLAGKRQDEGAHEMLMTCQDCLLHFQASSGCLPACLLQLHIYCLILCEREQISTRCAGYIIMNLNINLIYDNLFRKVASLKRESIWEFQHALASTWALAGFLFNFHLPDAHKAKVAQNLILFNIN